MRSPQRGLRARAFLPSRVDRTDEDARLIQASREVVVHGTSGSSARHATEVRPDRETVGAALRGEAEPREPFDHGRQPYVPVRGGSR